MLHKIVSKRLDLKRKDRTESENAQCPMGPVRHGGIQSSKSRRLVFERLRLHPPPTQVILTSLSRAAYEAAISSRFAFS